MPTPTPGQKIIPLGDWKRFLRVADWFERTVEHGKGVLRPTYGQALIVKTPEGGIDARDGETIFSATCIKCVAAETATAGEKTLHETDEELIVYNFHTVDVPGDTYVKTALSPNGTRYVEMESSGGAQIIRFSVISLAPYTDAVSGPCEAVRAEVLAASCASSVQVGDEVIIYDPIGCWFNLPIEVLELASGIAVSMKQSEYEEAINPCVDALNTDCWWLVQHLCCTEELYSQL